MPELTQANRPIRATTALGADALLLVAFSGREALSELFSYTLELIAPRDKPADFAKVLGRAAEVELDLPGGGKRYFHGLVNRFSQGRRDADFIYYRAEVVPQFWLWTKRVQSRIFQQQSVPDILKKVLAGLPVDYKIQGTFHKRDYCVQYRESDFAFASRLMEEEGIYYYFTHEKGAHKLVLANTPQGHADVPVVKKLIYEETLGGNRPEQRIHEWEKVQELRSGKVTLWDHTFELPHKHLEAEKVAADGVAVGKVEHKLALAGLSDKLEIYDFPGRYAQRFDGIDPGGGDRPADLQKIFEDNARTATIRLQEEAAQGLRIEGTGSCGQLTAGHRFALERHYDADGEYVLTSVEHDVRLTANFRSSDWGTIEYSNRFACIPAALPFRPPQDTPRPVVDGTQTAVVVGPKGEEIFTDKYGRVKVQFHWDRQGKYDENSSCWVRVATVWAGQNWGGIHIPRIGQEVVVDFLEGDPDQPIIVGSVYNADQMPPWDLPANKTMSGMQTRSSLGAGAANHNQIRFEDKKGSEQLHIHAEKNQDIEVEKDETHWVGHDRTKTVDNDETTHVKHDRTETVDNNETITIGANRTEKVVVNESIDVGGDRTRAVHGSESVTVTMMRTHAVGINEAIMVGGAQEVTVGGFRIVAVGGYQTINVVGAQSTNIGMNHSHKVGRNLTENVGGDRGETVVGKRTDNIGKDHNHSVGENSTISVGKNETINVGKIFQLEAGEKIVLKTGDASIEMKKDGTIIIKGKTIQVTATGKINVKADSDIAMKGSKISQN